MCMHEVKYCISTLCWLQNIEKALDVAATFRTMVYFYRLRDDPYLVSNVHVCIRVHAPLYMPVCKCVYVHASVYICMHACVSLASKLVHFL